MALEDFFIPQDSPFLKKNCSDFTEEERFAPNNKTLIIHATQH